MTWDGFKNMVFTLVACWAIWIGYRYLVTRIYLNNSGISVQGTVMESESHPEYCYVKFSYPVNGKTLIKSMRLSPRQKYAEHEIIPLRLLPTHPDDPHLEFPPTTLNGEIELFLLLATVYVVIRITRLMMLTTRPHYD